MEQQQSSFKEKERTDLREPQHFKVIIYNDDFTTMEFVVKILTTIFFKSAAEAETLMLQVHKSQSAVVGIYTYDIAQSKVQKATRMAREENFPLRLTIAPEEESALGEDYGYTKYSACEQRIHLCTKKGDILSP